MLPLLLFILQAPFVARRTQDPPAPPSVLVIVLDDVGYRDLVAVRDAGYLPNMTARAAQGFVFTNATSAPICSPTRRALHFGEFYSRQSSSSQCGQVTGDEPPLASVSLAEAVAMQGYASTIIGKWHLGGNPTGGPWPRAPQEHGWGNWSAGVFVGVGDCGGADYNFWTSADNSASSSVLAYQPTVMRQRFEAAWSALPSPRLVLFAAQLAHAPYHRPPAGLLPSGYPPTTTDRQRYEAMIAALDVQLGQLLAAVDLGTTAVVVVGDNGTPKAISSDPLRSKETTFQGGVHVPLFFFGAGIPQGASSALVSVADIYATVVELSGGAPDPALDSRSLLPLMQRTATKVRDYLAMGIQGDTPQFVDDLAARSLRWKFRRTRADATQPWSEELYDLLVDPGELVNVAAQYPAKVSQHRAVVDQELP